MPTGAPDALAEPLGVVVSLVRALDPAVAPEVVEEVVKALAARRATRRRLAPALLARPGVLVDGASPAPAVVGDLLVGRCLSCPPDDGPEPITILIKVITAVDPAIGAPAVIVAVEGAVRLGPGPPPVAGCRGLCQGARELPSSWRALVLRCLRAAEAGLRGVRQPGTGGGQGPGRTAPLPVLPTR